MDAGTVVGGGLEVTSSKSTGSPGNGFATGIRKRMAGVDAGTVIDGGMEVSVSKRFEYLGMQYGVRIPKISTRFSR